MEWLVALLVTVAGVEGWFLKESLDDVNELKKEIGEIEERGRINVTVSELEQVDKQIKLEIPISGQYILDTKRTSLPDELDVFRDFRVDFNWSYTVNLGYNFEGWVWCAPEKNDEQGLLIVEIPKVSFFEINAPEINEEIIPYSELLDADTTATNFAIDYGKTLIKSVVAEKGAAYEASLDIIEVVNSSIAKSLQDQLNAMQAGHNPISKLTVINRQISSCTPNA